MLKIVVRSKKDRDAVLATLSKFFTDWNIDVYTLHGARDKESILRELKSIITDRAFYLVLLGREDEKIVDYIKHELPPNVAIKVVPRARVRNTRIEVLAREINIGKALFRLSVGWYEDESAYIFSYGRGLELEDYIIDPAYDIFLSIGSGFRDMLSKLFSTELPELVLLVRKYGGEHNVYWGRRLFGFLKIPDEGCDVYAVLRKDRTLDEFQSTEVKLEKVLTINREVLKLYEEISINYLKSLGNFDTVVVPWSGGKDSTATLVLALKLFPKDVIRVIYVDTGLEFPQTLHYVEMLSKELNIELYVEYAGIDQALREGMPMPTHDNRWCTGMKMEAASRAISRVASGRTLILLGDRDAESRSRSLRPPTRDRTVFIEATPLKFWSTAHVQLYLLMNNIKLNPLYLCGFYRIGCYICPSLRSWELKLIKEYNLLSSDRIHRDLFEKFLKTKAGIYHS